MIAAAALFIYMHLWFGLAILKKRNDVADIAWGLGFVLLAVTEFVVRGPDLNPRSLSVLFLVIVWGGRLATYLAMRSNGKPEDPRYADMRTAWGSKWVFNTYTRVFWLQGVLLYFASLPLLAALRLAPTPLTWIDQAAQSIAMFGLLIEAIADYQKNKFKSDPANRGKICDVGLWSKSRHPNYFGEMAFWVGIATFSCHQIGEFWWAWLGPALIIFLLLKVSGIPLIEKRYDGRKDYEAYKRRTNLLVPFRMN